MSADDEDSGHLEHGDYSEFISRQSKIKRVSSGVSSPPQYKQNTSNKGISYPVIIRTKIGTKDLPKVKLNRKNPFTLQRELSQTTGKCQTN